MAQSNSGVPQIDFTPLGDLGKVYDDAQRRARREAILSSLPPDASTQTLGTLGLQLMRAGDAEGGIPLMRLADAASRDARDFDWRRQEAGRAQGNTDRILALRERMAGAGRGLFYRGGDDGEAVTPPADPEGVRQSFDPVSVTRGLVAPRAEAVVPLPTAAEASRANQAPRDGLEEAIGFVLRAATPATREGVLQAGRAIAGPLQKMLQVPSAIRDPFDRHLAENAAAMLASDDPAAVHKGVKLVAGNQRLRGALQEAGGINS
jgi:hypothetical protein